MHDDHDPALQPEDLDRLFLERAKAGDVEGVAELYEPTNRPGNATAEVARRRRDGTWRWLIDQPNVLG